VNQAQKNKYMMSWYVKSKNIELIEVESRMVVSRSWRMEFREMSVKAYEISVWYEK
jgi:hypothetical protein